MIWVTDFEWISILDDVSSCFEGIFVDDHDLHDWKFIFVEDVTRSPKGFNLKGFSNFLCKK